MSRAEEPESEEPPPPPEERPTREPRERPDPPDPPDPPEPIRVEPEKRAARASGLDKQTTQGERAAGGNPDQKRMIVGPPYEPEPFDAQPPDQYVCEVSKDIPPTERTQEWLGRDLLVGAADLLDAYGEDYRAAQLDMLRNYADMVIANVRSGADKYFHCKANCEAAQRGVGGLEAAIDISNWREESDSKKHANDPNMTLEKSKQDIFCDQKANRLGRDGAKTGTRCSDVCRQYRVRGL